MFETSRFNGEKYGTKKEKGASKKVISNEKIFTVHSLMALLDRIRQDKANIS